MPSGLPELHTWLLGAQCSWLLSQLFLLSSLVSSSFSSSCKKPKITQNCCFTSFYDFSSWVTGKDRRLGWPVILSRANPTPGLGSAPNSLDFAYWKQIHGMIGILPELQVLKWFNLILRQIDNKYYEMLLKGIKKTVWKTRQFGWSPEEYSGFYQKFWWDLYVYFSSVKVTFWFLNRVVLRAWVAFVGESDPQVCLSLKTFRYYFILTTAWGTYWSILSPRVGKVWTRWSQGNEVHREDSVSNSVLGLSRQSSSLEKNPVMWRPICGHQSTGNRKRWPTPHGYLGEFNKGAIYKAGGRA